MFDVRLHVWFPLASFTTGTTKIKNFRGKAEAFSRPKTSTGFVPHNHVNDHAMKSPNLLHCLVPKKNIAQISQPRRGQIRRYSQKNSALHERGVKNSKNHDNGFRLFLSFDKKTYRLIH